MTSIGSAAFQDCKNLEKINIPSGVTRIESNTFNNCGNLTTVVFCEGVSQLAAGEFDHCPKLTEVYIPKSITSMGSVTETVVGSYHNTTQTLSQDNLSK